MAFAPLLAASLCSPRRAWLRTWDIQSNLRAGVWGGAPCRLGRYQGLIHEDQYSRALHLRPSRPRQSCFVWARAPGRASSAAASAALPAFVVVTVGIIPQAFESLLTSKRTGLLSF